MVESNYYPVAIICLLLALSGGANASSVTAYDRTPTRIGEVMGDLQLTIQGINRIDQLEEAYWRGEGYRIPEDQVRKRDLKGFELQLEILRIRLNMPG